MRARTYTLIHTCAYIYLYAYYTHTDSHIRRHKFQFLREIPHIRFSFCTSIDINTHSSTRKGNSRTLDMFEVFLVEIRARNSRKRSARPQPSLEQHSWLSILTDVKKSRINLSLNLSTRTWWGTAPFLFLNLLSLFVSPPRTHKYHNRTLILARLRMRVRLILFFPPVTL